MTRPLFMPAVAVAVVAVIVVVGTLAGVGRIGPSETCVAAVEWRNAAQKLYFIGNDLSVGGVERDLKLHAQFRVLANIVLPPQNIDIQGGLTNLMRQHNSELEKWLSYSIREVPDEREAVRLELNATIRNINGHLVPECDIEPVILYTAGPSLP